MQPTSETIVTFDDQNYPVLLRESKKPPQALYYAGDLQACSAASISIIGSRKMTSYGEQVVNELIPALVRAGLVIVSGLAYGIDAYAHQIALKTGGKCVAVLGSGLDVIYPPRNRALFADIIATRGCVLSEYPAGTQPLAFHFPTRNRIVAGLSLVTLIIEAGENSGTLITARYALEAGRQVCVVPGNITSKSSAGANYLLKQGASLVTGVEDILAHYNLQMPLSFPETLKPALTGAPATLYDLISQGMGSLDDLLAVTNLTVAEVQSVLTVLELDGYIYCKNTQWLRTS